MRSILFSVLLSAFTFGSVSAGELSKPLTVQVITNDCAAVFDNLTTVTSGAISLTSKEQAGLVKIATDAKNLYLIGKTEDAMTKLYNYQVKIDQLAATLNTSKPKISTPDEQALRAALNEAIACVSAA